MAKLSLYILYSYWYFASTHLRIHFNEKNKKIKKEEKTATNPLYIRLEL